MAKTTTVFVCSNCGNESPKWFGKCPACNEWNTCYEAYSAKRSKEPGYFKNFYRICGIRQSSWRRTC